MTSSNTEEFLHELSGVPSIMLETVAAATSLERDANSLSISHRDQYCQYISCFRAKMQNEVFRLWGLMRVALKVDLSPESATASSEAVAQLSSAIESAKTLTTKLQAAASIQIASELASCSDRIYGSLNAIRDIYKERLASSVEHDTSTRPDGLSNPTALYAALELLFCENPFNMFSDTTASGTFLQALDRINTPMGPTVASVAAAESLGNSRVDDLMRGLQQGPDALCLDRVAESYIHILEGMRSYLDIDIRRLSKEITRKQESSPSNGRNQPSDGDYLDSRYLSIARECSAKVNSEIEREKDRVFRIGICGMTKAGKSLFLNAIIGQKLLPTDELPSTALPCRIRHGTLQEPHLVVCHPSESFTLQECIEELRGKLTDSLLSERKSTDKWMQLPSSTRSNWNEFKKPSFLLAREARGEEAVVKLLGQVNDVARLCYMFDVKLEQEMKVWPLLTVEFLSFIQESFTGTFEFFDLPGIDEGTVNNLIYVDLIESVRKHVYAIVPVVSLKQVPTSYWRSILPNVVNSVAETPIVICTHVDQFADPGSDNVEILTSIAWKVFNPKFSYQDKTSRCVACSSLLGFGAQRLLRVSRSNGEKPAFDAIYVESNFSPEYECICQICGKGKSARRNYDRLTFDDWIEELEDVADRSGIKHAVSRFKNTLLNAQSAALSAGIANVGFLISRILDARKSALQRLGRTREDCELAKAALDTAKKEIQYVKREWISEDRRLRDVACKHIDGAFHILEGNLLQSAKDNFKKELDSFKQAHASEGISDLSPGRVRFNNESTSYLFLSGFQSKSTFAVELIKNHFIERTRREIVDKQITDQVDFLAQRLSGRLDGTQKRGIIERVITETMSVLIGAKTVSLSDLLQNCRQRVREAFGGGCGKKAHESYYTVIDEKKVIDTLKKETIDPLVVDLRRLAMREFDRLMDNGRIAVEGAIKGMLEQEDRDFEKELSSKDTPPLPEDVAVSVAAFLNFTSAASAMSKLGTQYGKFSSASQDKV